MFRHIIVKRLMGVFLRNTTKKSLMMLIQKHKEWLLLRSREIGAHQMERIIMFGVVGPLDPKMIMIQTMQIVVVVTAVILYNFVFGRLVQQYGHRVTR